MPETNPGSFPERVARAAEAVLAREGSVGPLELFQELRWLPASAVQCWRKGGEAHQTLEQWIHVGPAKFDKAVRCFNEWVWGRGLPAIEVPYTRQSPQGTETLRVTQSGDPQREKFYQTRFVPADLPERQTNGVPEFIWTVFGGRRNGVPNASERHSRSAVTRRTCHAGVLNQLLWHENTSQCVT